MIELCAALSKVHDSSGHVVDIRGTVSLYWARYYYVFLVGRDRRKHVTEVLVDRRRGSRHSFQVLMLAILFSLVLVGLITFLLIIAYILKSAMGIDIYPDQHLMDILSFQPVSVSQDPEQGISKAPWPEMLWSGESESA